MVKKSSNWRAECSSSPEPFCGSISNEGALQILYINHNNNNNIHLGTHKIKDNQINK